MAIMSRQNNTKRLIKDLIWFVSDGAIEKSAPEFPNGNRRENIKKPRKKRGVKEQKYNWEIKEFTCQS